MTRREFPAKVRALAFQRSNGHCEACTAKLSSGNVEYDHDLPDWLGGEPTLDNCVVLCRTCHKDKTAKTDIPRIAKTRRQHASAFNAKTKTRNPIPGSRSTRWKRRMDGTVIERTGR